MLDSNYMQLIGYAGSNPQVVQAPQREPYCILSLAVNRKWKHGGKQQESTQWFHVFFYGKSALLSGERIAKGDKLWVRGQLQIRKRTHDDGTTQEELYIKGNLFDVLQKPGDLSESNAKPTTQAAALSASNPWHH